MTDATASDPIDDEEVEMGPTTGPPVFILVVAAVCVLVGLALLFVGSFAANVVGYVAASFMSIALVGMFRRVDVSRRLEAGYQPRPSLRRVIPIVLVGALVVAGLHVWAIATELAS